MSPNMYNGDIEMAVNKGKKFETKFSENWIKSFEQCFLLRLHDQVSGYKVVSQNPCDFISYVQGRLFLIECKSHAGKSFPFSELPQYERLLNYKNLSGVSPIVVLWLVDCDCVCVMSIASIESMKNDGKKSVNLKDIQDGAYNIITVPSVKKRVFLDSDYSAIINDI